MNKYNSGLASKDIQYQLHPYTDARLHQDIGPLGQLLYGARLIRDIQIQRHALLAGVQIGEKRAALNAIALSQEWL